MVVTNDEDGFRLFLCDTVTGKISSYVPPSAVSWGLKLNDAGSITATLQVGAEELASFDFVEHASVVRNSLGLAYGTSILEAGPIWEADYDPEKETLQLTASGLWSIFDHRKALRGSNPGAVLNWSYAATTVPAASELTYTNLSWGSIARELIAESIQRNPFVRPDGRSAGSLNIVLPASTTGSNSITYNGFELAWIGDLLRALTQLDGGPDIRLRPRFASDPTFVEWVLETGTDAKPLLVQKGDDWRWDASVAESGVVKLGVKRDGTGLASRAWSTGNGSELNMLVSWATDTKLAVGGYPWLEVDDASKSTEDPALLFAETKRALADSRSPWDQWTLSVRADQGPVLGTYSPGDWAVVYVPAGHPIIPAKPEGYRVRILAMDGDGSATVSLTVAPIQGSLL